MKMWIALSVLMFVVAIPNPHFPPAAAALELADRVLPDLDAL